MKHRFWIGRQIPCLLAVLALNLAACEKRERSTPSDAAESERIVGLAVRQEIGKADGALTSDDLIGVTELHLADTMISDLRAIATLRQLQGLSLSGCTRLYDLTPLENLPHLVYLDLRGCKGIVEIPGSLRRKNGLRIVGP